MLAAGCGDGRLQFNLSHTHGLSLIALTSGRAVGVDIEQIRPIPDFASMAGQAFARQEIEALAGLPEEQHLRAFFACWTRKEAYLKALGDGLSRPLDSFAVSVAPDEPARLLWVAGDAEEASRWWFSGIDPLPDAIGAVAVAGQGGPLVCWRWSAEST